MTIHLAVATPMPEGHGPQRLVLMEPDTTLVKRYECDRSFRRIECRGRTFHLAGRDRATGEMVYFPETA